MTRKFYVLGLVIVFFVPSLYFVPIFVQSYYPGVIKPIGVSLTYGSTSDSLTEIRDNDNDWYAVTKSSGLTCVQVEFNVPDLDEIVEIYFEWSSTDEDTWLDVQVQGQLGWSDEVYDQGLISFTDFEALENDIFNFFIKDTDNGEIVSFDFINIFDDPLD